MTRVHQEAPDPNDPTRRPWYLPPDPAWAPLAVLRRVREMLSSIDPRLNVFWYPRAGGADKEHPGRWAIVYWLNRGQCWSVVERWVGAAGEYRELSVAAIKEFVLRFQVEADKAAKRCEAENEKRQAERAAQINEENLEWASSAIAGQLRRRPLSQQRRLNRTHSLVDDIGKAKR